LAETSAETSGAHFLTSAPDYGRVPGGLLVLGFIHTEIMAVLENRSAPLYNRTTDEITLTHLDIASLKALLREHADLALERFLFFWTLFEGVPKFYRDCYEQGVLNQARQTLLRRIFFESSSPLRTEAEHWFLKELRSQYDVVLKFVARHTGCLHNELRGQIQQVSGESSQQVGGYLKVLSERYRLIEKKLPVFAAERARRGRYYYPGAKEGHTSPECQRRDALALRACVTFFLGAGRAVPLALGSSIPPLQGLEGGKSPPGSLVPEDVRRGDGGARPARPGLERPHRRSVTGRGITFRSAGRC